MKKLLLIFAMAVAAGCKDKAEIGFIVTDHKIINLLESDIIVETGINDRQEIIIMPGEIRTIDCIVYYHDVGNRPEIEWSPKVLEHMEPEMEIDGQIVPEAIWMRNYWKYDGSDVGNPAYFNSTYTLIITEELLETIKTNRQN